ncbi:TPA: hypothetical protein ACX8ZP_003827 [Escherichia coli]
MGFPSPAADYVEQRLSVNSICNVGPNTRVFERDGGYVVLDISLKPKQGSQLLIQHGGGGRAGSQAGIAGAAPGSGGGGAYDLGFTGTAFTGGDGATGMAIVEEFA